MDKKSILIQAIAPALFIIIWQLLGNFGLINTNLFPQPSKIASALYSLAISGELFLHIKSSFSRVIFGLLIGCVLGITFGIMTARIRLVDNILSPVFNILRAFPPVAIIPFMIVWFGISDFGKIFSITFAVIFPVWINTYSGAKNISKNYLRASVLLTNSKIKGLFFVLIPGSLVSIVAGIRNGIALGFIMVFVTELAGASSGIGYLISVSHQAYRMDVMIAGLFVLGLLSAFTDMAFRKILNILFPWLQKI